MQSTNNTEAQTMDITKRIEQQTARMERAELKWEQARQAGQTTRATLWQMQYEVEAEGLDELLVEEMEINFAKAMNKGRA